MARPFPRPLVPLVLGAALLALADAPRPMLAAQEKPRARALGIPFDGTPGPLNAITDVPGVEVGHATIIEGDGPLVVGRGPVRTGVTAVWPRGKVWQPVFAGWFAGNGFGEMTGAPWVVEGGVLGGPVMITGTYSVGVVRDAVNSWFHEVAGREIPWHQPVVGETSDAFLNDGLGQHVTKAHVFAALSGARGGAVPEGNVGGGTGMVAHGFKGGIGTASRRVGSGMTVGVLVQANYGTREQLTIAGVPVGREIVGATRRAGAVPPADRDGSIIVVVATDAPLLPHQLERLARRVPMGIARLGGVASKRLGRYLRRFLDGQSRSRRGHRRHRDCLAAQRRPDAVLRGHGAGHGRGHRQRAGRGRHDDGRQRQHGLRAADGSGAGAAAEVQPARPLRPVPPDRPRGTIRVLMTPKICANILETIGHTPLVRINRITRGLVAADVLAKVETFNPGNSIKDRMALKMIEDAERDGRLKPGGTIIEGTSGNTGMGLAIAAVVKGYKCIFTTTDKQSKEKVDALRAFGADVIVCPTDVDPEDPRSYYSVSSRLERETPNSWKANQYDNPSNAQAHYEQTGPEIWEQTDGAVDHLVVGVGTGGTICGAGRFLKERKPSVKVWGIDTYGSVFKKYKETGIFDKNEIYPYITEGIGEDFLPKNVDFSIIDHFEKVTDRDAAIMTSRIAREEGIFAGNSAGSAMAGLLQLADRFKAGETVVVIFHDHGTRYLGKMYNPEWMREKGFLDRKGLTAKDLVAHRQKARLTTIDRNEPVSRAANLMTEHAYSQLPVTADGRLVGSVSESHLFDQIVKNPELLKGPVEAIMEHAIPFADISTGVDALAGMLTDQSPAVLVRDFKSDETYIITRWDVIRALS